MTGFVRKRAARCRSAEWRIVRACALGLSLIGCGDVSFKSCGGSDAIVPPPPPQPTAAEPRVITHGWTTKKPDRKGKRRRAPAPKSTGDTWRGLAFFVPDSIEGYRARSVTEGRDLGLVDDLGFVTIKRAYGKDDRMYELELLDVSHCEKMRDVFNRSREIQRETATAVIRPTRVQNHKALTQWFDSTHTARTSVLVADRFLVNLNVKPADSPEPSLTFIEKLDWPALDRYAATPAPLDPTLDISAATAPTPAQNEPPPSAAEAPDSSLLASQPQ
ncbi:MAG TPA: hypothetical protein VGI70_18460 [Polyangiales bacterium]|jgi:hypothetical protein